MCISLMTNMFLLATCIPSFNLLPIFIFLVAILKLDDEDFPGDAVVKNPPANAGDTGSSPGPGRSHVPRSS